MFWKFLKRKDTDEARLSRMRHAKAIIDDPLFKEAFEELEFQYYQTWLATKPMETALREKMYLSVMAMVGVRNNLTAHIEEGEVTQQQIEG